MNKWESIKTNYIDKNIKIIPIIPNQKIPMIERWNEECSSDMLQILYWYESNHDMNFAIPCYENNLFVIDLDRHDVDKDGVDNFNKLLNDIFDYPVDIDLYDVCDTLIQETPSGGLHIIFQSDEDLSKVNGIANAFKNYPGIDLRNRNYIVAEPSTINGKSYHFLNNKKPQKMPKELKEFILKNATLKNESKKEPYKKPTSVEVGDRDNQLFSYINSIYYKTRLDYDEILCLANHFNETVFEKPLPERDVRYKCKKVFDKDRSTMIFINLGE
jgi:hypothetical protein